MIKKEDIQEIIEMNKLIEREIKQLVEKDLRQLYDGNLSIIQKINIELEKNSIVIKIPIDAPNIGGFIYKTHNNTFCYINTSQIRVFQNFVTIHEYYHLMYDTVTCMVTLNEESSKKLNERKANYYASLMLLNESSLRNSYISLTKDKKLNFEEVVCNLIDLYKVPRKTILLRLCEIDCIDFKILYKNFETDINKMKSTFDKLGLDKSCLQASYTKYGYNIKEEIQLSKEHNSLLEDFIYTNEKKYEDILNRFEKENH